MAGIGLALLGGSLAVLVRVGATHQYVVVNIGASLPMLLFACAPVLAEHPLEVGTFVQFRPPARVLRELTRLAPAVVTGLPWVKRVAARAPAQICWADEGILIDGRVAGRLPLLMTYPIVPRPGCETLGTDEVFVLGSHPQSYDSRYFGPLTRDEITAVCHPLLPWEVEG